MIDNAKSRRLGQSEGWTRLLYYNSGFFKGRQGLIDDPQFYLSSLGKTDPERELEATLMAFLAPQDKANPDEHALCRFPARATWLRKELALEAWPNVSCPRLDAWMADRIYTGMSIVFSSFYPDNPASMFGHTFIILHRQRDSAHRSEILDDIVNFAAYPTTSNPFLYGFLGATGGFPGRFSIMPYYMKIQEYTNLESRDLWEYRLKVNPEELNRIVLSLWEFGPHHADYFYFDENCSFLLLALMENGNSHWELVRALPLWVTPTQTLQIAIKELGTEETKFRASALSRYRERYDSLDAKEQSDLADLLMQREDAHPRSQDQDTWKKEVNVQDAALEYFDFTEKLGGNNTAKKYASLRTDVLNARSRIATPPQKSGLIPWSQDPSRARSESWLSFGTGQFGKDPRVRIRFQPVLHDLLNNPTGYSEGMEIQLMPMQVDVNRSQIFLTQLDLLRIVSISPYNRLLRPPTWTLNLGWRKEEPCFIGEASKLCSNFHLAVGKGAAVDWESSLFGNWVFAALLKGQAGFLQRQENEGYFDLGPEIRILYTPRKGVRSDIKLQKMQRWFEKDREQVEALELGIAAEMSATEDLRAQFIRRTLVHESGNSIARNEVWLSYLKHF